MFRGAASRDLVGLDERNKRSSLKIKTLREFPTMVFVHCINQRSR